VQVSSLERQLSEATAQLTPLRSEVVAVKTAAAQLRAQSEGALTAAKRNMAELERGMKEAQAGAVKARTEFAVERARASKLEVGEGVTLRPCGSEH